MGGNPRPYLSTGVPLSTISKSNAQGFADAGEFTALGRLRTSIRDSLRFWVAIGALALFGLVFLIATGNFNIGDIKKTVRVWVGGLGAGHERWWSQTRFTRLPLHASSGASACPRAEATSHVQQSLASI